MGVTYIPVAHSGELQPGERKAVDLNGRPMVLARIDGDYFAFSRQCPHEHADLINGPIVAGKVRCNNHGYCFDLQTGDCVLPEGESGLTVLPVEERDGEVCVRIDW